MNNDAYAKLLNVSMYIHFSELKKKKIKFMQQTVKKNDNNNDVRSSLSSKPKYKLIF